MNHGHEHGFGHQYIYGHGTHNLWKNKDMKIVSTWKKNQYNKYSSITNIIILL